MLQSQLWLWHWWGVGRGWPERGSGSGKVEVGQVRWGQVEVEAGVDEGQALWAQAGLWVLLWEVHLKSKNVKQ